MAPARSQHFHVALLAGGSGTRFWPLSRTSRPKQLLALTGDEPLLVASWKRVRRLAPPRRIWVVAPAHLVRAARRLLPELRPANLIVEPAPRDTGPAIALACARIAAEDPAAIVGLFPTDHVIRDRTAFQRAVQAAVAAARGGALVCLGIRPDRPATGFGYLQCAARPRAGSAVEVRRFVEKPDLRRARQFLRAGTYLWNGGMFVWRAGRFLEEAERVAPEIARPVRAFVAGKRRAWDEADKRSVDYAVMERARGVRVVPLDAGWDDVGSWEAAARVRRQGRDHGTRHVLVDSPGAEVFGAQRLVALVDVPGITIVDTPDALLVVSREGAERVREVVQELRRRGRDDLL